MKRLFNAALLLSVVLQHSVPIRCARAADDATTAPAVKVLDVIAPKDLQARAAANVPRVELQWTDNIDGEAGFIVERSVDGGKTYARIGRGSAGATAYVDTILPADTTFTYRVRAIGAGWETHPADAPTVRTADFRVFDALLHRPKPSLARFGMERIRIAAGEFFWVWERGGGYDRTKPNQIGTRRLAQEVARSKQVLVINIEHWPVDVRTDSEAEVDDTIRKLTQIVVWIRDEAPNVRLGFYGLVPLRDYWTPVNQRNMLADPKNPQWAGKAEEFETKYRQWEAANAKLAPLAAQVDYVFPSLYTFDPNTDYWTFYATENVAQAKRYGKPVFPFLWMDYHDSTTLIGQNIPPEFWRLQLQTMREEADGIVLWGGVTYQKRLPRSLTQRWREEQPWWVETQRFLRVLEDSRELP